MLVERGADPCFKNRKGKTPCDVAASAVHNFLITARGKLKPSFAPFFCIEILVFFSDCIVKFIHMKCVKIEMSKSYMDFRCNRA